MLEISFFVTVKIAHTETVHSVMSSSPWPDFDKSVAELRDWLTLLERMLKSQRVTVADVSDIEHTINNHQVCHKTLFTGYFMFLYIYLIFFPF